MEEQTAAFIMNVAPFYKRTEYSQRGVKRVLEHWRREDPDKFTVALTNRDLGVAAGFNIRSVKLGQYGYDTELHFAKDKTPDGVDEEALKIADEFYELWMGYIQDVIEDSADETLFTPKELAVLYGSRHKMYSEKRVADNMGISVGTYRGKLGRVREKIETAKRTLELDDYVEEDYGSDGSFKSCGAHFSVIERVDEERLPLDTVMRVEGVDIQRMPVEELISREPLN